MAYEQPGPEAAATAASPGRTAAPAAFEDGRQDHHDEQHRHHGDHIAHNAAQEVPGTLQKAGGGALKVVVPVGRVAVVLFGVLVGVALVVELHLVVQGVKELPGAGIVVPGGEVRLQVLIQQPLELGPVEHVLHPGPGLEVVVLLGDGQHQQEAVVPLLRAHPPGVEQVVGVVLYVLPV